MEIMLLANSYFMVTFNCIADRNRVFEGGPYFHNQVGLFIKPWHAGFIPSEVLPNHVLVWVRLPRFLVECCREDTLYLLASLLGIPVGSSLQTLGKKVMTFAHICVEIDLSKPLPDAVDMCARSFSWVQQLDYETLPFRCRLCHEYGHLQRKCPIYKPMESQSAQPPHNPSTADKGKGLAFGEVVGAYGFVQVKARSRNRGQKRPLKESQEEDTFNRFEVLDDLSQQEVNPGLVSLEQEVVGSDLVGNISEASVVPPGVASLHVVSDQQLVVAKVPVLSTEAPSGGGDSSHPS